MERQPTDGVPSRMAVGRRWLTRSISRPITSPLVEVERHSGADLLGFEHRRPVETNMKRVGLLVEAYSHSFPFMIPGLSPFAAVAILATRAGV